MVFSVGDSRGNLMYSSHKFAGPMYFLLMYSPFALFWVLWSNQFTDICRLPECCKLEKKDMGNDECQEAERGFPWSQFDGGWSLKIPILNLKPMNLRIILEFARQKYYRALILFKNEFSNRAGRISRLIEKAESNVCYAPG